MPPEESVTCTVKLPLPAAEAAPVITPLEVLRLNPAGRLELLVKTHELKLPEPPLACSWVLIAV
jgi:hypothetical protein